MFIYMRLFFSLYLKPKHVTNFRKKTLLYKNLLYILWKELNTP